MLVRLITCVSGWWRIGKQYFYFTIHPLRDEIQHGFGVSQIVENRIISGDCAGLPGLIHCERAPTSHRSGKTMKYELLYRGDEIDIVQSLIACADERNIEYILRERNETSAFSYNPATGSQDMVLDAFEFYTDGQNLDAFAHILSPLAIKSEDSEPAAGPDEQVGEEPIEDGGLPVTETIYQESVPLLPLVARRAPVSIIVLAISTALFAALNIEIHLMNGENLFSIVAPNQILIWNGRIWGVLTSTLVHLHLFHWFFNMYWLVHLGMRLEADMRPMRYLALAALSAVAGSSLQLLATGQTGIGFSGVLYGFVGYELIRHRLAPDEHAAIKRSDLIFLLAWLGIAFLLSRLEVMNIANGGHLGGLVAGVLFGLATFAKRNRRAYSAVAGVLLAAAIGTAVYAPWSPFWETRRETMDFIRMRWQALKGTPEEKQAYAVGMIRYDSFREEALRLLEENIEAGHVASMNSLAWYYATTIDPLYQNGTQAIRLAQKACEATGYQNPDYLDTLAAAYARTGDWEAAVIRQMQ
jgi:membrane associated rhomboid family serine protease